MVHNQGLIGDQDHIVGMKERTLLASTPVSAFRLAEFENLVQAIEYLITGSLVVDQPSNIELLELGVG